MTCSVMIATRDRRVDLELTCANLECLAPGPDEVLVCADGCRDGTAEMLRRRFPRFRILENPTPMGSLYSRDRLLRLARGEIVLSLDDDSWPLQRHFLATLVQVFADHPDAAVIVFPELRDGAVFATADKTDRSPGHYVSAYANCAAAMRRDFYLTSTGFPLFFGHMYEEPDYALQCYAGGAAVWFEPSLTVYHRVSQANRHALERHHLNARNELWSVWLRCPWPWLPMVSVYRACRQLVYSLSEGPGWVIREPTWWLAALRGLPHCLLFRQPVAWRTYYGWMRLARRPAYALAELRKFFPAEFP